MRYFKNKKAWTEAVSDTAVGTIINFPLNLLVLSFAFNLELSVFSTAVITWVVFTVIAIVRKYMIRLYFKKKSVDSKS